MIKNIIFDLSEVIISGYHGVEKTIEQNTGISALQFLERKNQVKEMFLDTMRGKYSENEYFECLLQGTQWNISKEELKQYARKNFNIAVQGTMQIIQDLKNKYKLILLSDHIKEWAAYILENNKELEIFEHQYFSYEFGKLKSDKGTFSYIMNSLQIRPEETVFIDDYKENIEMARKEKINGIVFQDAKQLKCELRKMQIL